MDTIPSRKQLVNLYIKRGKSVPEISKLFKFSEHKINYWIHKFNISKRSISDALYVKNNPNGDPFGIKEISTFDDAKLWGLGVGLYWGEGNKKSKDSVRLGNTDPALIRKFMEFLIKILGVNKDKIRFGLQIFSDMPKLKVFKFWLEQLKTFRVKREQFYKIIVTPARSIGTYREKSKYGVLSIYFANVKLKKILDNMLPL